MKLKILGLFFFFFSSPMALAEARRFRVVVVNARLIPVKTSGNCWDLCSRRTARKLKSMAKQLESVGSFEAHAVSAAFAAATRGQSTYTKGTRMPDPFVKVLFSNGQKILTHAVKNTMTPEWGTSEEISLQPKDTISIQVWDKDLRMHDKIGELRTRQIPLKYLTKGGTWRIRFQQVYELTLMFVSLKPRAIRKFQPGHYRVIVHGADIAPKNSGNRYWDAFRGYPDPYVVLWIGKRKITTPVVRNSLRPRWNYAFKIFLSGTERFLYHVYDQDFRRDDRIGSCTYQQVSHLVLRYSKHYRRRCQRIREIRISFERIR